MTKGHTAVMAQRRPKLKEPKPWEKLEFFPTPPWATRALFRHALRGVNLGATAWEPCAGLGHMSSVLWEFFQGVRATDVYIYPTDAGADGAQYGVQRLDFLDRVEVGRAPAVDWIISNPPFSQADQMVGAALTKARVGIAFLLRMQWLEGAERFHAIFSGCAPTIVAPFVERVPMCEGGWDPAGSSATMYAWFVWLREGGHWRFSEPDNIPVRLIPPGCKERHWAPSDLALGLRCVPGWIAPSVLKKASREQISMEFAP